MNNLALNNSSRSMDGLAVYSQTRKCLVFRNTEVPIVYLWDAVMNDETVSDFISRFPLVDKEDAYSVIRAGARATDGF